MSKDVARPWVVEEVEVTGNVGGDTRYAYPTTPGLIVAMACYNVDDTNAPVIRPCFVDSATLPTKAVDFATTVTSSTTAGFLAGQQTLMTTAFQPVPTRTGSCWACVIVGTTGVRVANTRKRKIVFVIQPE